MAASMVHDVKLFGKKRRTLNIDREHHR